MSLKQLVGLTIAVRLPVRLGRFVSLSESALSFDQQTLRINFFLLMAQFALLSTVLDFDVQRIYSRHHSNNEINSDVDPGCVHKLVASVLLKLVVRNERREDDHQVCQVQLGQQINYFPSHLKIACIGSAAQGISQLNYQHDLNHLEAYYLPLFLH